ALPICIGHEARWNVARNDGCSLRNSQVVVGQIAGEVKATVEAGTKYPINHDVGGGIDLRNQSSTGELKRGKPFRMELVCGGVDGYRSDRYAAVGKKTQGPEGISAVIPLADESDRTPAIHGTTSLEEWAGTVCQAAGCLAHQCGTMTGFRAGGCSAAYLGCGKNGLH